MSIDLWANFLYNEKFDPKQMFDEDVMELVRLCEKLSETRGPKIRPHAAKLESRRFVVETAMDLSIDLSSIQSKKGKYIIGRGLLDIWNVVYGARYGSNYGTVSLREAQRRDIKTKISKEENK